MVLTVKHEGVSYELDEVDLQWTLEECRGEVAAQSGSFKVLDDGEWKLMLNGKAVEGERMRLSVLGLSMDSRLEMVRVDGSNRPPRREVSLPPPAPDVEKVTCRFDAVIDLDDAPHTLAYAGMRSRLRDDAALRELSVVPDKDRPDALRAVYAAVNDMLAADDTDRALRVGAIDVRVLIVDD